MYLKISVSATRKTTMHPFCRITACVSQQCLPKKHSLFGTYCFFAVSLHSKVRNKQLNNNKKVQL